MVVRRGNPGSQRARIGVGEMRYSRVGLYDGEPGAGPSYIPGSGTSDGEPVVGRVSGAACFPVKKIPEIFLTKQ